MNILTTQSKIKRHAYECLGPALVGNTRRKPPIFIIISSPASGPNVHQCGLCSIIIIIIILISSPAFGPSIAITLLY